jgi:hypothetical protein
MVSGASQSSGTAATFCVRWLVTASSSTEPVAESASQRAQGLLSSPEAASSTAGAAVASLGVSHATPAHSSAKAAKSHDQRAVWPAPPRLGSSRNG